MKTVGQSLVRKFLSTCIIVFLGALFGCQSGEPEAEDGGTEGDCLTDADCVDGDGDGDDAGSLDGSQQAVDGGTTEDAGPLQSECENGEPIPGCLECPRVAVRFDGQSCIEVPGALLSGVTSLTIEFWAYVDVAVSSGVLVSKWPETDGDPGFRVLFESGSEPWENRIKYMEPVPNSGGASAQNSLEPFNPGAWIHFAVVRESTGAKQVYVDGVPGVLTSVAPENRFDDLGNTGSMFIGCEHGDARFFNGRMDELRISEGRRYSGTFAPPQDDLVPDGDTIALYHFDETSGDQVSDATSNQLHGTWQGNPLWVESPMPCPMLSVSDSGLPDAEPLDDGGNMNGGGLTDAGLDFVCHPLFFLDGGLLDDAGLDVPYCPSQGVPYMKSIPILGK